MILSKIKCKIDKWELYVDHKMYLKRHFHNEPTPEFSSRPTFNPKSMWKPPNDSPNLKLKIYLRLVRHL